MSVHEDANNLTPDEDEDVPIRDVQDIDPPPTGKHQGFILSAKKADDIVSPFDKADDPKPKVKLEYQLTSIRREDGTEYVFSELYTSSNSSKSKLGKHLAGLLGSMKEVKALKKLNEVVGKPCVILVGHKVKEQDDTVWPQVLALEPIDNNGNDAAPF